MPTAPDSLLATLEEVVLRQPAAPALTSSSVALDYRGMWSEVHRLSSALRQQGLRRVGLCGDNSPAWVIADLACLAADIVCVPIPPWFSSSQTSHIIEKAGLNALLWTGEEVYREDSRPLTRFVRMQALEAPLALTSVPRGTAKLTFTSGSTGTPKGVCLSSAHLAATAGALQRRLAEVPIERHLCVLPLATLLENVAGVYLPLLIGAEVQLPAMDTLGMRGSSEVDPAALSLAIRLHRPQSMILVPELASLLTSCAERGLLDGADFRFIAVGGGRVSLSLIERARAAGLPLYEGYGLSECGSVVALNVPGSDSAGTGGQPLDHVRVSQGRDRQIRVSGNTFLGYLGDAPQHVPALDTGDLGYVDDRGFLHVDGRAKNLLITGFGRNISPEWLESELIQRVGARQSLVFGDGEPGPRALLTVFDGRTDDEIREEVCRLNRSLPDYARIVQVHLRRQPLRAEDGHVTANGRLVRTRILSDLPTLLANSVQIPIPSSFSQERSSHGIL